jgi:hypothetical protein
VEPQLGMEQQIRLRVELSEGVAQLQRNNLVYRKQL